MIIVKFNGKWVQVAKFARSVKFSADRDWFMVVADWEKPFRKRQEFKWVHASTRFESVREIVEV